MYSYSGHAAAAAFPSDTGFTLSHVSSLHSIKRPPSTPSPLDGDTMRCRTPSHPRSAPSLVLASAAIDSARRRPPWCEASSSRARGRPRWSATKLMFWQRSLARAGRVFQTISVAVQVREVVPVVLVEG